MKDELNLWCQWCQEKTRHIVVEFQGKSDYKCSYCNKSKNLSNKPPVYKNFNWKRTTPR